MTHALVIGAGVAGPTLAMALLRTGVDVTVFEADPAGAEQRGAWVTFQANGMDALAAIDAAGPLEKIGYDVTSIHFVNGRGRSLGTLPLAAPRPDGRVSQMMRRADLYAVLAELARDRGARIHHGKRLAAATSTRDGRVEARFDDGTVVTGDLLIGCDGIHSAVRRIIDPGAPTPRYVPVLNVGGYIPDFVVDVPPEEFRMQFGSRCFFAWMGTPDGGTVWFANPPMEREPERGVLATLSDAEWRAWLHSLMRDDAGPAARIVDAAPGPLIGWATYDMPVLERWHTDNMIVIGDAAHATAPSAGQGASMALEDAVVLAQCLRDRADAPSAFATFDRLRRKRVEKIVAHGARGANMKAQGPVLSRVRDLVLPFAFARGAKDGGASMSWLQGHHIEFDRPIDA